MALQLTRSAARPAPRLLAGADLLPALTGATLTAALVELLLLRLLSRIAVHIPDVPALRGLYSAAVYAGTVAFPVAALLAAALLAVAALTLLRTAPWAALPALALIGAQAALLATGERALGTAAIQWLLAASLFAALFQRTRRATVLVVAAVAGGQALGLAQAASANLAAEGGRALPLGVAHAGEGVVLAALLATPALAARRSWRRGALLAGGAAGLVAAGLLFGNGSTAATLALWTFGLSMPLPALLYAVAAGTVTATLVTLAREGQTLRAAALGLMVLGGFVPANSYQNCLLLGGVLLLLSSASNPQQETEN